MSILEYSILGNKEILVRVDLISWEMLKSFPHSFQENRELDPSTNIYFILFLSGKHPVLHNVYMACGFSGHGIQQVRLFDRVHFKNKVPT